MLPLGAYTDFRGVAVDATAVLIAYTRTADANLDGVVNDDDVTIVGAAYAPGMPNTNWAMGDFDYNGFVDDDDVTLLGAFYEPGAAPPAAANYEGQRTKDENGPETFGLWHMRGRETRAEHYNLAVPFSEGRSETGLQLSDDEALIELLAESIANKAGAGHSHGRWALRKPTGALNMWPV
jgi:hypothetical protein